MLFLAFVLPPLAVLLCGKPATALLNLLLTCLFWIPGVIHAIAVVSDYRNERRTKRMIRTLKRESKQVRAAATLLDHERERSEDSGLENYK